jgi:hypothetical protein
VAEPPGRIGGKTSNVSPLSEGPSEIVPNIPTSSPTVVEFCFPFAGTRLIFIDSSEVGLTRNHLNI